MNPADRACSPPCPLSSCAGATERDFYAACKVSTFVELSRLASLTALVVSAATDAVPAAMHAGGAAGGAPPGPPEPPPAPGDAAGPAAPGAGFGAVGGGWGGAGPARLSSATLRREPHLNFVTALTALRVRRAAASPPSASGRAPLKAARLRRARAGWGLPLRTAAPPRGLRVQALPPQRATLLVVRAPFHLACPSLPQALSLETLATHGPAWRYLGQLRGLRHLALSGSLLFAPHSLEALQVGAGVWPLGLRPFI
jgi:hypothetical protein